MTPTDTKNTNTKTQPICEICQKLFSNKSNHKTHILTIHQKFLTLHVTKDIQTSKDIVYICALILALSPYL